jgi:tetraacyldisaccharide 4'-kinase
VGQDRPAAARALCAAHPSVDVIVADDGLQHRALARQAELIVFDERGAGNGMLLPAGPLRQPVPQQLGERARVLYSNGRQSTALPGGLASRSIERAWPLAAWAQGDDQPAVALQALAGRPLIAAAGIAAPEKFFSMLQAAGLSFAPLPLPDHHPFATLPWPDNAPDVVVTEKDAVKIARHPAGGTRVWVVPLDFQLPVTLIAELSALLFPERLHELRPPPDRPAGVPGVQGAAGDAAR